MGLAIGVTISGDARTIDILRGAKTVLEDFTNVFEQLGLWLVGYYGGEAFKSQGGVYAIPWPRLAPATQAYKIKHYRQYTTVPLMATGTMSRSFIYKATSRTLTIGNTAPYFMYHQSTAPRTKIPWRPMMLINTPIKDTIKAVITDDINAKISTL